MSEKVMCVYLIYYKVLAYIRYVFQIFYSFPWLLFRNLFVQFCMVVFWNNRILFVFEFNNRSGISLVYWFKPLIISRLSISCYSDKQKFKWQTLCFNQILFYCCF